MKRFISLMLAVCMIMSVTVIIGITPASAADIDPNGVYVTPNGSGSKDGSSWDNAMAGDQKNGLQAAWDKASETGTVYVGSGNYLTQQTLVISPESDGKSLDEMKSLVGVDSGAGKPVFFGPFTLEAQGGTWLQMKSGASFIKIDNFSIKQYMYPIDMRGKHHSIRIYNLDTYEQADGIYMRGGATAEKPDDGNKDIIVDHCNFIRYTKSAIRILDGNNGVLVTNCVGDAGGVDFYHEKNFPLGFHHLGGDGVWDENITYVDCVGMNAYQKPIASGDQYWNGDGFCGEGSCRNITYIRCRAYNNTDGGWDDKSKNPVLIDCISVSNKRNLRFWTGVTLINNLCATPIHPAGAGMTLGMWAGRYCTPKIYNSTFYNAGITSELGGLEMYDSIFARTSAGTTYSLTYYVDDKSNEVFENSVTWDGTTGVDPQFVDPTDLRFDGKSDKYNSLTYGASKGYYYSPETYAQKAIPTEEMPTTGLVDNTISWAADSVNFMVDNNYMPGLTTGAFAPYSNMTRLQFAVMLVRSLGIKAEATDNFIDMDRFKKWKDPVYNGYYDDIAVAKAAGITAGDGAGYFHPGQTITRQDMMVMLGRALKISGKVPADYQGELSLLDNFSDKGLIADYAKQEIANVIAKGVIAGNADGTVNPLGQATRAEGAVIGKRVVDLG